VPLLEGKDRRGEKKGGVMKKAVLVAIVLSAVLVCAAQVVASDIEASLGVKLWSNTWKETISPAGGGSQEFNNGSVLMAGPALQAKYGKNWFAGITYLKALEDYESANWYADGDKMAFDRTDMDLLAGYLVRDPLNAFDAGFFLTYKTVDAHASYTNQAAGITDVGIGTWKLSGPGLGILAEKRLDALTFLNGSVTYLMLEQEFAYSSGGTSRFDANGWAFEVSVAHAFTGQISADVGLKYQWVKGQKLNGDIVKDTFSGLTAGIAYTF